ncbi:hypothetical protein AGMMS49959_10220 [Planctomycetales bacterium]|nr:hypothetical protein AGMMS49959_10220 [Planctomycetales bacterium]
MICVSPSEMDIILTILKTHAPECEARAFGSRYKRTPKTYSDLDLALCGKEKMTTAQWGNVKYAFAESDLPFRVDVLDWHDLSKEFRAVIERGYEVIYSPEGGGEVSR